MPLPHKLSRGIVDNCRFNMEKAMHNKIVIHSFSHTFAPMAVTHDSTASVKANLLDVFILKTHWIKLVKSFKENR